MSIFGAIATGRMVQTDFQNVDQTKFLINIHDPDSVNHIVVFMTGAQPFPDGYGGAVYFCWPSPDAVGNWQLLGFISNAKPSAIFRISKHRTECSESHAFSAHGFNSVAQLGISVEPLAQIQFQAPSIGGDAAAVDSHTEFCTKMAESLFNHLASYGGSVSVPTHPGESFFPMRALEQWYSNFRRRLAQNPNFWKGTQ